jgi:hypothetical protein
MTDTYEQQPFDPGPFIDNPGQRCPCEQTPQFRPSFVTVTALAGIAADVISLFMALLSFRGISTPSLQAQGEQRCSSYFNNDRDIAHIKWLPGLNQMVNDATKLLARR